MNDTSFFYETKSYRIEKNGYWIILANNNEDLNSSFNYYSFERMYCKKFSRIKEEEAFDFIIDKNEITAAHYNVKNNEYIFDKYAGNKSYELLCSELENLDNALMLTLNSQISNLIILK